jgi:hypothetical protein
MAPSEFEVQKQKLRAMASELEQAGTTFGNDIQPHIQQANLSSDAVPLLAFNFWSAFQSAYNGMVEAAKVTHTFAGNELGVGMRKVANWYDQADDATIQKLKEAHK